jgi:hypothetical protein
VFGWNTSSLSGILDWLQVLVASGFDPYLMALAARNSERKYIVDNGMFDCFVAFVDNILLDALFRLLVTMCFLGRVHVL